MMGNTIYHETFRDGPGDWTVGKDWPEQDSPDVWHKNMLGHHGKGVPPEWVAEGGTTAGFVRSTSPWYFDDNHGEFCWFHLVLTFAAPGVEPIAAHDFRNAEIELALRANGLDRKDCQLFFWLQGLGGRDHYYEHPVFRCWAHTAEPLEPLLIEGDWQRHRFNLVNDEARWSSMGLIKGGLNGKIRVVQSLTSADGTLDQILNGNLHNMGLILCYLNPVDLPSGSIELAEFKITTAPG